MIEKSEKKKRSVNSFERTADLSRFVSLSDEKKKFSVQTRFSRTLRYVGAAKRPETKSIEKSRVNFSERA